MKTIYQIKRAVFVNVNNFNKNDSGEFVKIKNIYNFY